MQENPPLTPSARQRPKEQGPSDRELWRLLSEARTPEEFCTGWLGLQARAVSGTTSGLVMFRRPGSASLVPVGLWPPGSQELDAFRSVVDRALQERKGVVVRNDVEHELDSPDDLRFLLAYPVRMGESVQAVAALQITPRQSSELQQAMRQLQWGSAWLQKWALEQEQRPDSLIKERLTWAMELAAQALGQKRFASAATGFVTELATRLECDRVSIGFLKGKQVKVRALSHSAQFGKQMNLIRSIGLAMGESVDQQGVLLYPAPEGASSLILHSHEQLARTHGDCSVLTVPFVNHEGTAFGALTLERSTGDSFDLETAHLCEGVAALVGPLLEEKRQNDRLVVTKLAESLWLQIKKLVGPKQTVRKLIASGILFLVLFFAVAKGDFRVTAKMTLEGAVQRVVTAPHHGYIAEAPVRGGDLVKEGQLMALLDDRDLRLERSRWSHEREQYVLEKRRAMAERDTALMNVLAKRISQSEAQISLLDDQIARTRITAPFDGIVVNGDLSQSLGAPVDVGQQLFEVAPLDSYRVMLKVSESDISHVQLGQSGGLILTAIPGERFPFTISKITPVSISEEGKSFFMVEAELGKVSDRLRPGMEGFGKIAVDRRRLLWIWTHDMTDWVRLKLWSWLP